jgi:glycosyltransferase involved in cell wall biosynthesis
MISANGKSYPVKVSIVLPTYNQCRYLQDAIQTILIQTFTDFELIVVNDGSTDNTAQYLASLNHPKIRVITQHNQGLPNALNTGFDAARGEYWTWTSSDNVVAQTWLEELVKALENSPPEVGYALSHYAGIDDNGTVLFVNSELRFDLPSLLMRHSGNASFLYRAELAKKIGAYDPALAYAEDLDMWVRMAEVTRAVHVETVLYYYRIHANSMTVQKEKVRAATQGVVDKYLAKNNGLFDVDKIFPAISLSADPALEKWKSRIWLATLGAHAAYYCPVNALVDQLYKALNEHYDRGLVVNIVHLLVKEGHWDIAAKTVALYQQKDNSDLLNKLADIISRKAKAELDNIPFLMIEEKFLAADCKSLLTQKQLIRNLASFSTVNQAISFETLVTNLVNQLEDQKDHPEIWQNIAAYQSAEDKQLLHHLRLYVSELVNAPQEPQALVLLKIIEAVCLAYTDNISLAKNKLQQLAMQHPNLPVLVGALTYLNQDARILAASLFSGV